MLTITRYPDKTKDAVRLYDGHKLIGRIVVEPLAGKRTKVHFELMPRYKVLREEITPEFVEQLDRKREAAALDRMAADMALGVDKPHHTPGAARAAEYDPTEQPEPFDEATGPMPADTPW